MSRHIKRNICAFLSIVTLIASIGCANKASDVEANSTEQVPVESTTEVSEVSEEFDAQDFIDYINVGYTLGNSLDSCYHTSERNDGTHTAAFYETYWGNPVTTQEFMNAVSAAGFNTIRIPVTWYFNTYTDDNGYLLIRNFWLQRVQDVVDYALNAGLYVILDSHHDGYILTAELDDIDTTSKNLRELWTQIATYFKDYDERLVFEGFNELNTEDTSWVVEEGTLEATNTLNQVFVDTVRACGGYNTSRILICQTYLANANAECLDGFVLPTDSAKDKLIIGIHSYDTKYNQHIESLFEAYQIYSERFGAPLLITEFGTTDTYNPIEYRDEHAGNYVARAAKYGLKCIWWDDGGDYKLMDRTSCTITEPEIVAALINPVEYNITEISNITYSDINSYSFSEIDKATGALFDSTSGHLTLVGDGSGIPVTPGVGYNVTLSISGEGDGLRLYAIAYYDASGNMIPDSYVSQSSFSYDGVAPEGASYMKVEFNNPWGPRSYDQYSSYLENSEMIVTIIAYEK